MQTSERLTDNIRDSYLFRSENTVEKYAVVYDEARFGQVENRRCQSKTLE